MISDKTYRNLCIVLAITLFVVLYAQMRVQSERPIYVDVNFNKADLRELCDGKEKDHKEEGEEASGDDEVNQEDH